MKDLYLYGASGHGKVIKEIVEANGGNVAAFIDDNPDVNEIAGLPVMHSSKGCTRVIVSIGSNRIRKMIVERLEDNANRAETSGERVEFATAIHPSAVVSPSAKIGEGSVVMAGAVINADAVIGKHCIVNTGATIDHDVVLGDYVHVAPGVNISGITTVGEGTWVGVGSCVIQCLNIGKNCMIGAGSVVIKDIPDGVVAYGNPCRVVEGND